MDYTPPAEVIITGFNSLGAGESSTWCTDVFCCENPTFDWSFSYNGFNYTSFFGGACATQTMSSDDTQDLWLRVTVTCDNGQTATDTHRVRVKSTGAPGDPEPLTGDSPDGETIKIFNGEKDMGSNIRVFPNPANNVLNVRVNDNNLDNGTTLSLRLLSSDFTEIKRLNDQYADAPVHFNVTDVKPGLYFLEVVSETGVSQIKKIVIQ